MPSSWAERIAKPTSQPSPVAAGSAPAPPPPTRVTDGLSAKERDQLRLHQRLERMSAPERVAARDEQQKMRHDKTLERWGKTDATKASKVIYLNDLLVTKGDALVVASDKRKAHPTAKVKSDAPVEKKRNKMKTWSKREKGPSSMKKAVLEQRREMFRAVERMVSSSLEGFEEVPVVPAAKGKKMVAPSLVSMLMGSSSDSDNESVPATPRAVPAAISKPAPSQEAADQLKKHRDIMGVLEATFESVRMAKRENDGARVLELVTELRKTAAEARHALAGIDLRLQTLDIVPVVPDDVDDDEDDTERATRCSFFPPLNRLGVGRATLALDWRTPKRYPKTTTDLCPKDESLPPLVVPSDLPQQQGFIREYVTNVLTDHLDDVAFTLIQKLRDAQRKLKDKQPLMYKSRMRYVTGLREALTGLAANRVRAVLLAPDVEAVAGEAELDSDLLALSRDGAVPESTEALSEAAIQQLRTSAAKLGLDGCVRTIIAACRLRRIPVVFCMSRQRFAHALGLPKVRFSIVAIYSATGAYDEMRTLVKEADRSHVAYNQLLVR